MNSPIPSAGVSNEIFTSPSQENVLPISSPAQTVTQPSVHYAGFWIRVAASLIDAGVYALFSLLLAVLFSLSNLSILSVAEKFTSLNFYFFVLFLAFTVFLIQKTGATLGKKAVGIKIVFENGDGKSTGKILLRELIGKFISSIFLIGYIITAFTKRKRSLHDMMVKTVVVYEDEHRKILGTCLAILSLISILAIYFGLLAGSLFSFFKQHAVVTTDTKFKIETERSPSDLSQESEGGKLSDIEPIPPTPESSSEEAVPCVGPQERCGFMKRADDRIKRFIVEFATITDNYRKAHGSYKNIQQDPQIVVRNYIVLKSICISIESTSQLDVSPDGTKLVIHQPLCSNPAKSYCYDENSTEVTLTDTAFVTTKFKCQE